MLWTGQKILFPKQKSIQMETLGVDLAVTPERVILLDCQVCTLHVFSSYYWDAIDRHSEARQYWKD